MAASTIRGTTTASNASPTTNPEIDSRAEGRTHALDGLPFRGVRRASAESRPDDAPGVRTGAGSGGAGGARARGSDRDDGRAPRSRKIQGDDQGAHAVRRSTSGHGAQ